jgi:hypothetical protein
MPLGTPSTTRHAAASSSTTRTVVAVTGLVVGVLTLAAWGVTTALRGPNASDAGAQRATHAAPARPVPAATPLPAATTAQDGPQVAFGNPNVVDNVDVLVSSPTRFTPTPVAATSDGSGILVVRLAPESMTSTGRVYYTGTV